MSSTEEESRPSRDRKPEREHRDGDRGEKNEKSTPRSRGGSRRGSRLSATDVARQAAEVLSMLTGRTPESVTGIERHDDGWRVRLEVVETHRIPETADLMALYDVDLDASGEFTGHRRVRRYSRGQGGED